MSHSKLRSEKNCLNCGAQVTGRYCNQCGQENVEPKQSLWHLMVHFFNDFTHFDGKFFSTLRLLLFRPGFLSLEHMRGRRTAYLDPIRMYIFTSAVAFLVFFSIVPNFSERQVTEILEKKETSQKQKKAAKGLISGAEKIVESVAEVDTGFYPSTIAQYDSFQRALPPSERDNFFDRYFNKRGIKFGEKARGNSTAVVLRFVDKFLHSFPQMVFVSLPFFAFALYLLNIRRRREYYYAAHAVFSIHLYCAAYILMILLILVTRLDFPRLFATPVVILSLLIYQLIAMKRFYVQSWFKTIVKYIAVNLIALVVVLVVLITYLVNILLSSADNL